MVAHDGSADATVTHLILIDHRQRQDVLILLMLDHNI